MSSSTLSTLEIPWSANHGMRRRVARGLLDADERHLRALEAGRRRRPRRRQSARAAGPLSSLALAIEDDAAEPVAGPARALQQRAAHARQGVAVLARSRPRCAARRRFSVFGSVATLAKRVPAQVLWPAPRGVGRHADHRRPGRGDRRWARAPQRTSSTTPSGTLPERDRARHAGPAAGRRPSADRAGPRGCRARPAACAGGRSRRARCARPCAASCGGRARRWRRGPCRRSPRRAAGRWPGPGRHRDDREGVVAEVEHCGSGRRRRAGQSMPRRTWSLSQRSSVDVAQARGEAR